MVLFKKIHSVRNNLSKKIFFLYLCTYVYVYTLYNYIIII